MKDLPIGVFDSGLGGLTVVGEMLSTLPSEDVVYLGDTARCPYGPQRLSDVRRYVLEIGQLLVERRVKLLVVACNTGTAAGLALAQRVFDVPVIGVVEPGARAAVQATVNRRVGVIGTVGTIESGAYSRAVRALDEGVTVFSAATPKFVEVVEQGLRTGPGQFEDLMADASDVFVRSSFYEMARDYLDPLKRAGIDTLVLGCTHFPLLSAAIGRAIGSKVRLISSAEETAGEVREMLDRRGHLRTGKAGRVEFLTTGDAEEFAVLGSRILRRSIPTAEHVTLESLRGRVTPAMEAALAAYEAEVAE